MKQRSPVIVGAGFSGLLAAHGWRDATILERAKMPTATHRALLRFRSPDVAQFTGIPFRRVTVRKAIWYRGHFVQPTVALANQYSVKVLGRALNDRSIWNLDSATRYIAPEDFYERLLNNVGDRIQWGTDFVPDDWLAEAATDSAVVCTAPLHLLLACLGIGHDLKFTAAPISVVRFRIADCDLYQTVYFPDSACGLYRASITKDLLIAESMNRDNCLPPDRAMLANVFGLPAKNIKPAGAKTEQRYGKIAPVDDAVRRALIAHITQTSGIYCLGRFATWRNILLDDLPNDIAVIKRLMASDDYAARLKAHS